MTSVLPTRNSIKIMFKPGSCIRNRHESTKHKERGTYAKEA
jgi:hypothetical protein